jgi:hypothetical protein
VIREVEKKEERNETELAQVCEIWLSTWSVCLKCPDSVEQQALQGDDISKWMRICGAYTWWHEEWTLEWFCSASVKSIVVDGHTAKEKVDKVTLKMGIEFKCLNGWLPVFQGAMEHNMASHEDSRYYCREVALKYGTYHAVCSKGRF